MHCHHSDINRRRRPIADVVHITIHAPGHAACKRGSMSITSTGLALFHFKLFKYRNRLTCYLIRARCAHKPNGITSRVCVWQCAFNSALFSPIRCIAIDAKSTRHFQIKIHKSPLAACYYGRANSNLSTTSSATAMTTHKLFSPYSISNAEWHIATRALVNEKIMHARKIHGMRFF